MATQLEKKNDDLVNFKKQQYELMMWGYFPGVTEEQGTYLASPATLRFPESELAGDSWENVCAGGCGFGLAISASGKLMTWGSADDQGLSYLASGKNGEVPGAYSLPTTDKIVNAAAGWAHCVSASDKGEVFSWGWKECVPNGNSMLKDVDGEGGESSKRRKLASEKANDESLNSEECPFSPLCVVRLDVGVKINVVSAGGRHTLALSDAGQVWGWGYGGEGQLGLGSRVKMVSSPLLIPCIGDSNARRHNGDKLIGSSNYIKGIACGGRHSAVITDTGVLLTFGWGFYGQCGQGDKNDLLQPKRVPTLEKCRIKVASAGLWHTLCICNEGHVYVFGSNQFGQLGVGAYTDHVEIVPKQLNAPALRGKKATMASSGARHNAILTDDGQVFCWGWNKYGQLGVGDTIDRNVPYHVPLHGCVPKNVACGWWHTLALCESII